MDNHSRLLAMLGQAVSAPPTKSTSSSNQILSPPPSGAVREPSPFPPPPSLQSLSVDDLMRQFAQPPPPAAPAPVPQREQMISPPASGGGGGGGGHQNKLLGMLSGAGGGGGAVQSSSGPGLNPPQPQNGVTSPPLGGSNHTLNLLGMFKSPSPASQPPAIQPNNGSEAKVSQAADQARDQIADPSPPPHAAGSTSPRPAATTADSSMSMGAIQKPQVPSKSPFDFVSPFDVFDKPSPKPVPAPAPKPPAKAQQPQQKPESTQSQSKNPFAVPPARINGTVIHPGNAEAGTARPQQAEPSPRASPLPQDGTPQLLPPADIIPTPTPKLDSNSDLNLPWLQTGPTKGNRCKGPKKLGQHVKLDFSKLGDSALVETEELLDTIPMTLLKLDKLGYRQGRHIAMSKDWIAYALPRGRVRLIDTNSGAKLVLNLPSSVEHNHVVDIVATPTLVAVLTGDSSVTIYQVPATFTREDAQSKQLAHLPAGSPTVKPIDYELAGNRFSKCFKLEWVAMKDAAMPSLAIAGPDGIIFVELEQIVARSPTSLSEIAELDLLEYSDAPLAFGINHAQSAMAVITATHISLYSLATRSRVWHKPVADSSAGKPSSLQFCESNILVGRNNNKTYELIQLHPNHAILSTIELIAPSPNPANLHYSQAIYDSANSILWMAAFARGSLFGFRYSLKGQPPVRDASVSPVSAFDEVIEMPLDSIVSMVSCAGPAGPEIFYATPQGFTKATIDSALLNLVGLPSAAVPGKAAQPDRAPAPVPAGPGSAHGPGKSTNGDKKDNKAGPKAKHVPKGPSPASPAPESAAAAETAATEEKPDARALAQADTAPKPSNAVVSAPAEFATLLKQTEDRLSNRFKQSLETQLASATPKLEQISGASVAAEVSAKVEAQIKAAVSAAVQQELTKSLVPAASTSISSEIRNVAPQAIQTALTQSLSTLSRDVERSLAANIPRIISTTILPTLERTLQDTFKQTVIPALASSSDRLADHIVQEFKSEMVQVRKDFHPPPPVDNGPILQSLVASVAALQKKVEQLSIANAASPTAAAVPAPAPPGPPIGLDVDEVFTQALATTGPAVIFQLVSDFWGVGEYILPSALDRKSPLSQPIILTLLHRLAACTTDLNPSDPTLVRLLSWERRVAIHLNVHDPGLKQYLIRVIPSVIATLEATVHALLSRFGPEAVSQHMSQARSIIEILQSKQISA